MFDWFKKRKPSPPSKEQFLALVAQASLLSNQNDWVRMRPAYESAVACGAALHDTFDEECRGLFRAILNALAVCRFNTQDPIGAADLLMQVKEDPQCVPEQAKNADAVLANIKQVVPFLDRAVQLYRKHHWDWRADQRGPAAIAAAMSNEAVARMGTGDADGALVLWERVELLSRQVPSYVGVSTAMCRQAEIYAYRGDKDRSVAMLKEGYDHTGLEVFYLGGESKFDEQAPDRPIVSINLRETKIQDGNLALLQNAPQLKELNLAETDITDEGLRWLSYSKHLTQLFLQLTLITDGGLHHLHPLHELQMLFLGGTKITDRGLALLQPLSQLEVLIIGGTDVTDAGLAHLRGLKKLWNIDLRDTKITDAGLEVLKEFTALRKLNLTRTQVTPQGVERLKAALPQLKECWVQE